MLTLESILKATRQMGQCGELQTGAMDHLPERVSGHGAPRRLVSDDVKVAGPHLVRRWDDVRGVYVYVEV